MNIEKNKNAISKPRADFPFESRYVMVDGYRMHYVEEGKGDPVLFIHGNPTSSYLWRNIFPQVARDTGKRGIALDLLGFGRSEKPAGVKYSVRLHYELVEGFIDELGLKNVVLALHDWGGPIGTAYAVRHPENVRGIALMETFVWPLAWKDFGKFQAGFRIFRSPLGYVVIQVLNAFVNRVLPAAVLRRENMTEEVMRRYREPFPTIGSRRAVRMFPQLLPIEGKPVESDAFIEEVQQKLPQIKSPVLWIKADPGVINSKDTECHLHILKRMLPQLIIKEFGPGLHYLQEDNPERIAALITEWMRQCGLAGRGANPFQPINIKKVA